MKKPKKKFRETVNVLGNKELILECVSGANEDQRELMKKSKMLCVQCHRELRCPTGLSCARLYYCYQSDCPNFFLYKRGHLELAKKYEKSKDNRL